MKIIVCSFTGKGRELGERLLSLPLFEPYSREHYEKIPKEQIKECWKEADLLIFIGAAGIAVRYIADCLVSKAQDPAVLVLDERGAFVIPLVSGHLGGGVEYARNIAKEIGATPVITTATDVEKVFAVDEFARKNHLYLKETEKIKIFSSALLGRKKIVLRTNQTIDGACPEGLLLEPGDDDFLFSYEGEELRLSRRPYVLGLGCRKEASYEELRELVQQILEEKKIPREQVAGFASIDLKKEERCMKRFRQEWHLPFYTFSAEELQQVEGSVSTSAFVKNVTGVDNVCERSALLLADRFGDSARLIKEKTKGQGVTAAIASYENRFIF